MLDTRTRASIFRKLVPLLGENDANALMSELPVDEGDELVTKSFLRAELAGIRGESSGLRVEFAELRAEMATLETRLTMRMGAGLVALASLMVALEIFR